MNDPDEWNGGWWAPVSKVELVLIAILVVVVVAAVATNVMRVFNP
jgi:hypothetical protein